MKIKFVKTYYGFAIGFIYLPIVYSVPRQFCLQLGFYELVISGRKVGTSDECGYQEPVEERKE